MRSAQNGSLKAKAVLQTLPLLTPYQDTIKSIYSALGSERQIGMAEGPIPHSACQRLCRDMGLNRTQTVLIWDAIYKLDSHIRQRNADAAKASK